MPEAMLFNKRQGVVLDDIVRFWKADKVRQPCIFFVDTRGDSFHVIYAESVEGRERRDSDFRILMDRI